VVVGRLKSESGSFGFNAETEAYEDLMKAGIVDPTKVTRLALQNAASIAGLLLTTHVVVTEKSKKKKSAEIPEEY
jgi:chaperonin GroEL